MSVTPAAATPRLRDLLAAAPDGPCRVLHQGPQAVYLGVEQGGGPALAVGVLASTAVRVPNGLRTALPRIDRLDLAAPRLVGGRLVLGREQLAITRLVDAQVPRLASAPGGQAAEVLAGVGRGDGLTPYGDDVACGWLATRAAAGLEAPTDAVRDAARRTTTLSATLLECALHGEAVPELGAWLRTRSAETEAALLAVGASSGRGLLEGALLAIGAEAVAA